MAMASAPATARAWSDLPRELLPVVMAGLAHPADQARFRAVCRSWHSVPPRRKLSVIVLPTGFLLECLHNGFYRVQHLPEHHRCIGSTHGFLAVVATHDPNSNTHYAYKLLNPCSQTLVELPELDEIIGNIVSKSFEIHKVLMQPGPDADGLIAVRTNNRVHPIILLKPGKGVWLPPPRSKPFTRIIDVAFLGDTLYGITKDENLLSFTVSYDNSNKGTPMVTGIKRVITGPISTVVVNVFGKEKHASRKTTGDYIINDGMHFAYHDEKPRVDIVNIWYLVESHGKLLMVRREMERPCFMVGLTHKVEVFEADMDASKWVSVSGGLHGHALFLSKPSSRSLLAGDEIQEDAIYFIDTGEVFDMKSKTTSPPDKSLQFYATWYFYPGSF